MVAVRYPGDGQKSVSGSDMGRETEESGERENIELEQVEELSMDDSSISAMVPEL